MEQFAGMSILTTNLDSSLDAAVKRRLRFTLFFEMPEAPQRALLWQAADSERSRRVVARLILPTLVRHDRDDLLEEGMAELVPSNVTE